MAKAKDKQFEDDVLNVIYKNLTQDFNKSYVKFFDGLSFEQKKEMYKTMVTSAFEKMMTDVELVACVCELFKNGLNVSETSRDAFLHRNTLLYRIDKIKKVTGLNIKNFDDAFTFKLLMVVYYEYKKGLC